MADDFQDRVRKKVQAYPIVLFIKGTKQEARCGFSAAVLNIFNELGKPYETVDVLANTEIRSRMEEFSHWPTFPQVFVGGEFVGGCDIVTEMHEKGELAPLVERAFKS
jgi:monothiol glutaredoxin